MIHTQLDEEIFFPACRAATAEEKVEEAQVAHDSAKILIADLMREDPRDRYRDAKVKVLAGQVKAQIGAEESADGLFAAAQKAGVNNTELGSRIAHRRRALEAHARSNDLPVPRPVLLCAQALDDFNGEFDKEDDMNSQSTSGRDDRGHFTSDDDGGSSRRSSAARNEGSSRSCSRDDDDDRRRSRSQSREDDEDGRHRGGWFGDPEGHAEAARRGWEERR